MLDNVGEISSQSHRDEHTQTHTRSLFVSKSVKFLSNQPFYSLNVIIIHTAYSCRITGGWSKSQLTIVRSGFNPQRQTNLTHSHIVPQIMNGHQSMECFPIALLLVRLRSQCYFCDFVTFLTLPMWLFFPEGTSYPNIVKIYIPSNAHFAHNHVTVCREQRRSDKLCFSNNKCETDSQQSCQLHSDINNNIQPQCHMKDVLRSIMVQCNNTPLQMILEMLWERQVTDDVVLLISAIIKYCKLLEITRKPQRSIVQIKATAPLWIMIHTWQHSATQGFSGYRTLRAIISNVLQHKFVTQVWFMPHSSYFKHYTLRENWFEDVTSVCLAKSADVSGNPGLISQVTGGHWKHWSNAVCGAAALNI